MPITTTGSIVYFKDDLGLPLIGGKVYTYEYSTSKPKDTYKTAVRELPHTNPVILNDSGSVEWYLKGDYTIRVYTSEDVFVEEFNIVTPSKVQVDEVSDSLNLLKSELKNAAYRDTGAAAAQVPLNSDLGTAAYKDVGAEAGNVMEVGAFGLGGLSAVKPNAVTGGFYSYLEDTGASAVNTPSFQMTAILPWVDSSNAGQIMIGLKDDPKIGYRNWLGTSWSDYRQLQERSATGNVEVVSIQAGIGAPKIAYKKLTGTMPSDGTLQVPHGLNDSKILDYNILVSAADGKTVSNHDSVDILHNFKAHIESSRFHITATGNSTQVMGRPFRIIITYEV